jgi:PEP-CTERM motif
MKNQIFAGFLGIAAALSTPYAAAATMIFDSSLGGVSGSGLGTVSTILTFQSPGSGTFESGSVSRSGGADVKSDTGVLASGGTTNVGNVKTGASQTLTRTLGANGITKASEIAIVFNANEPSGNSIVLTGLQMSIFNGNTDIFDADLAASMAFATTFTGIGNQGFVFKLDTTEAAALQALLDALTPSTVAALRIGLSASTSDATGGPETFNVATISPVPVPEPATLFLFAVPALAGLSCAAWRRWGKIF